jgi:hypothetical protein
MVAQPAGTTRLRLPVGGGVADLRSDERAWGAVGGGLRLETPRPPRPPTATGSRSPQAPPPGGRSRPCSARPHVTRRAARFLTAGTS